MADSTTTGWKIITGSSDDLGFTINPDFKRGINVLPDFHMWDTDFVGYIENGKDCGSLLPNKGGGGSNDTEKGPCDEMGLTEKLKNYKSGGSSYKDDKLLWGWKGTAGAVLNNPNYYIQKGSDLGPPQDGTPGFDEFDDARGYWQDTLSEYEWINQLINTNQGAGWNDFLSDVDAGLFGGRSAAMALQVVLGMADFEIPVGELSKWKELKKLGKQTKDAEKTGKEILEAMGTDVIRHFFERLGPTKTKQWLAWSVESAYSAMVHKYLDMYNDNKPGQDGKSSPCDQKGLDTLDGIDDQINKNLKYYEDEGNGLIHSGIGVGYRSNVILS